jgi:hypothetical protein
MRRQLRVLLVAGVILAALHAPLAKAAPATGSSVPFKVGDNWVYRHVVTDASGGNPQSGTLTVVYRGKVAYRGQSYHYLDSSTTLIADLVERDYVVWSGGVFRQAATTILQGAQTLEIVFDKTSAFTGRNETVSGFAQIYENGAH